MLLIHVSRCSSEGLCQVPLSSTYLYFEPKSLNLSDSTPANFWLSPLHINTNQWASWTIILCRSWQVLMWICDGEFFIDLTEPWCPDIGSNVIPDIS